jgi:hypothetical protein
MLLGCQSRVGYDNLKVSCNWRLEVEHHRGAG